MPFKIESKEMYPVFVSAKYCWSIHTKVVRLGKHVHSKQKSHSYTNSSVLGQAYVHALLVQHLECIFSIYDLVWSKIRSLDAEKAEKLVKIYRLCRAEEDTH